MHRHLPHRAGHPQPHHQRGTSYLLRFMHNHVLRERIVCTDKVHPERWASQGGHLLQVVWLTPQ